MDKCIDGGTRGPFSSFCLRHDIPESIHRYLVSDNKQLTE